MLNRDIAVQRHRIELEAGFERMDLAPEREFKQQNCLATPAVRCESGKQTLRFSVHVRKGTNGQLVSNSSPASRSDGK